MYVKCVCVILFLDLLSSNRYAIQYAYMENVAVAVVMYKRRTHVNWFSREMMPTFDVDEECLTLIIATSSIIFQRIRVTCQKVFPKQTCDKGKRKQIW